MIGFAGKYAWLDELFTAGNNSFLRKWYYRLV
jgi:hypothetical protein